MSDERYTDPDDYRTQEDEDRTYSDPATWQKITRPDGEELGYFCGFSYPGDPSRWHEPHSADGRTCRVSAPTIWDRFTRAQLEASAAAQSRDRAR